LNGGVYVRQWHHVYLILLLTYSVGLSHTRKFLLVSSLMVIRFFVEHRYYHANK